MRVFLFKLKIFKLAIISKIFSIIIIQMIKDNNSTLLFLLLLISLVSLVYFPGLSGGFIYDDYSNFLHNPAINNSDLSFSSAWTASMSGISGPLGRPVAMLSFYLNYQLSEFTPFSYKLFNLFIHLLNTALVYLVSCRLIKTLLEKEGLISLSSKHTLIAFWITAIWAVHPINLTAVLYSVQRMTSMSATFVLLGILSYLKLRTSITISNKLLIIKLGYITSLGVLAALCKENGLLLFVYLIVIESVLLKWKVNSSNVIQYLKAYYMVVLVIPLCIALFLLFKGDLTEGYSGKGFDMMQRLMTELRVIWFYIFLIFLPRLNQFNLYHDDFFISLSLVNPITTIFSLIAFLLLFFIVYKTQRKWFVFGIIFFFSGHLMESTVLPLNLVHEHRNYLPSLGLILVFVISMIFLIEKTRINAKLFFCVIIILFSALTMSRAGDWSNPILLSESLVQKKPYSVTANYQLGETYSKLYQATSDVVYAEAAIKSLLRADLLSSNNVQPAIALLHLNSMLGNNEHIETINKIAKKFSESKVTFSEINSYTNLINCKVEKLCALSNETIMRLFSVLLENANLSPNLKDDALLSYAVYLAAKPDSLSFSISIINELTNRHPERLDLKVKYISLLLSNGEKEKANHLMEKISREEGYKWNVVPE